MGAALQLHAAWQRPKAAAEQREELRVVEKESQLAAMMPAASASMAVPVGLAAVHCAATRWPQRCGQWDGSASRWWLPMTFGRTKSMRRKAWRGRARLSAHRKWTKSLYLRSPRMYVDALRHRDQPHVRALSDTTENAAVSAGRARVARSRRAPSEHVGWAYWINAQPECRGSGARAAGAGSANGTPATRHFLRGREVMGPRSGCSPLYTCVPYE